MIDIALDTSILRGDPSRRTAPFATLNRLAKKGVVKIHIPTWAVQEYESWRVEEYDTELRAIRTALKNLRKKNAPIHLLKRARELHAGLGEAKANVNDDFREWLKAHDVRLWPIEPTHGRRMADRYFAGDPPFGGVKKRDDMPDCFVFESFLDIAATVEGLHVVAADKRLKRASEKVPGICAYESLDEFLRAPEIAGLVRDEEEKKDVLAFARYLGATTDLLPSDIGEQIAVAAYGSEFADARIPDDNGEARVDGMYEAENLELSTDEAEYYGDGLAVIPFRCEGDADLGFAIFKPGYWGLDDDEAASIHVEELNDHYYLAQKEYHVEVEGRLAVQLDLDGLREGVAAGRMEEVAGDAEYRVDSVDVVRLAEGEGSPSSSCSSIT